MPVCLLAVPSWVGSDTGQPTPPRGAQGCPLDAEPCLSWPVPQGLLGEQLPAAAPWGHPAPPRLSGESPPAPCLLVPLPPCSPVRREAVQKVNLSLQVKSRVPSPWLWLCAARSSPRPHRQRAERLGVWPRCWALFPAAPARLALPVLLAWNGFSVVWREAPLYRVDLGGLQQLPCLSSWSLGGHHPHGLLPGAVLPETSVPTVQWAISYAGTPCNVPLPPVLHHW